MMKMASLLLVAGLTFTTVSCGNSAKSDENNAQQGETKESVAQTPTNVEKTLNEASSNDSISEESANAAQEEAKATPAAEANKEAKAASEDNK